MLGSSKERKELKAAMLYKSGVISLRELHRQLEIVNSDAILKEMAEERQSGIGGGGGGGRTPRMTRGQRTGKMV